MLVHRKRMKRTAGLRTFNPKLARAEKEFFAGKRWSEIKVRIEFCDGMVVDGPIPLKTDSGPGPIR